MSAAVSGTGVGGAGGDKNDPNKDSKKNPGPGKPSSKITKPKKARKPHQRTIGINPNSEQQTQLEADFEYAAVTVRGMLDAGARVDHQATADYYNAKEEAAGGRPLLKTAYNQRWSRSRIHALSQCIDIKTGTIDKSKMPGDKQAAGDGKAVVAAPAMAVGASVAVGAGDGGVDGGGGGGLGLGGAGADADTGDDGGAGGGDRKKHARSGRLDDDDYTDEESDGENNESE